MVKDKKDFPKSLATAILLVIFIFSETIIFFNANQRYGYHIDELLSFGHSNSSTGGFLFPVRFSGLVIDENDAFYNHWAEPDVFWDYLTVQQDEVFQYSEIKNNLSDSVHPPLYYFFLHTVSSFFPETFSKWLGIIPNMALFSIGLLVLNKIGFLLMDSRTKSLLACAVYGLSLEAVNTTIFIRSYLLLTVITLLFVLEVFNFLLDGPLKVSRLIKIALLAILGLLTHYYFYIFLALFSFFVCAFLLLNGKSKKFFIYVGIVGFSTLLSFFVSPNALRHLFLSTRGLESGLRAIVGLVVLGLIIEICLLIYRAYRKKNSTNMMLTIRETITKVKNDMGTKLSQSSIKDQLFILLFLALIVIAIVIKLVAPGMDVHSDRYYFNLIPLFCLTGIMLIFSLLRRYHLESKGFAIIAPTLLLISLSTNLFMKSAYLFPVGENRELLDAEIQDSVCLLITDSDGIIHNFVDVFFTAEKVLSVHEISAASIHNAFSELDGVEKLTVIIDKDLPIEDDELSILEDQVGFQLQYLYDARHGHFLYRVYALASN